MLHRKYPRLLRGLARLQAIEDRHRISAMFPVGEEINGLRVLRLTPRHYDQLLLIGSVFLISPRRRKECDIHVNEEDVGKFLWIISTLNPLNQPTWKRFLFRLFFFSFFQQRYFLRRIFRRHHGYALFEPALDRYYERMFFDQPGGGSGRKVATSFSAALAHRVAGAYGWPDEVLDIFSLPKPGKGILDMPLPRLFQYWRWIAADQDPSAPLFSRLRDRYRDRVITKWRVRAQAAGYRDDPLDQRPRLEGVEKYLIAIGKLPSSLQ